MAEQNDKFKRVKYLRGLEKFVKSAISGLKREDFDDAQFRARRPGPHLHETGQPDDGRAREPYSRARGGLGLYRDG